MSASNLSSSQDMATEFVNGTLGRVEEIVLDETNAEMVKAIRFRPDGSDNILTIPRRKLQIAVKGVGMISRSQFPLIPAFAVTVHRVQGATLEGDVHVLLNSDFFADGQAYVALSRCRSLEQLHLWCLDRDAIRADANVSREYKRLGQRRLTRTRVEAAPLRSTPPLPALSRLPASS